MVFRHCFPSRSSPQRQHTNRQKSRFVPFSLNRIFVPVPIQPGRRDLPARGLANPSPDGARGAGRASSVTWCRRPYSSRTCVTVIASVSCGSQVRILSGSPGHSDLWHKLARPRMSRRSIPSSDRCLSSIDRCNDRFARGRNPMCAGTLAAPTARATSGDRNGATRNGDEAQRSSLRVDSDRKSPLPSKAARTAVLHYKILRLRDNLIPGGICCAVRCTPHPVFSTQTTHCTMAKRAAYEDERCPQFCRA